MKLDNINKWLTLFANLGVLAGIIFLSMEISQSNRIAARDSRTALTSQHHAVQMSILENPDVAGVLAKLADGRELTRPEEFQAHSYALVIVNEAAALNQTYENEFISERVLQRYLRVQAAQIQRVPGIAPYLSKTLASVGLDERGISPIFDNLLDAIERQQ